MRPLTKEEREEYRMTIRRIRDKAVRAREKFFNGDLKLNGLRTKEKEIVKEEADFIKNSGVIMYFGKLFKADV